MFNDRRRPWRITPAPGGEAAEGAEVGAPVGGRGGESGRDGARIGEGLAGDDAGLSPRPVGGDDELAVARGGGAAFF
jgi:hypothetical protein